MASKCLLFLNFSFVHYFVYVSLFSIFEVNNELMLVPMHFKVHITYSINYLVQSTHMYVYCDVYTVK